MQKEWNNHQFSSQFDSLTSINQNSTAPRQKQNVYNIKQTNKKSKSNKKVNDKLCEQKDKFA